MEFFDVLTTRRSIRSFLPDPIPAEDVAAMLKAGSLAPSAMNQQPWDFVVVTKRETLDLIAKRHPHARYAAQAPLVIVVCGTPQKTTGEFWIQDCAAATENILLAARALGYGTCWCGLHPIADRAQSAREILSIPQGVFPVSLIVVGRTDVPFTEAQRCNPAKIHDGAW